VLCFIAEAFFPAAPLSTALDAVPRYEGKTKALFQQSLIGNVDMRASGSSPTSWHALDRGADNLQSTVVFSGTRRLQHMQHSAY
jgi:hypothetical protein